MQLDAFKYSCGYLPDSDRNGDDRRHQNTALYRLPINFKIVQKMEKYDHTSQSL